jgi:type VI secretion system secreted protein VgrG
VGVSPGTAITGFPPGSFTGTEYPGGAVPAQAESDLTTAYNTAAGEACGDNLTNQDLGGMTLLPGVYCFDSSAQLTGIVTLNTEGKQNPQFVFQIGSTLTTASNSSVSFMNDSGQGDDNVFWQVGSSATLGTSTSFAGDILALTSITLNTGTNIQCGSALAQNGAVTLDTNDFSICPAASGSDSGSSSSTPEPSTGFLILLIGALLWLGGTRTRA